MSPAERDYFRTIAAEAFRRGRLQMLGLRLSGRFIALKCNFLCPPGSFAFKIAYDEAYARFSPGVQLELDNVHLIHARPELEWMDSCAVPGHPMIERLWSERRTVESWLIAGGRWLGPLALAGLPWLRRVKRYLRRPANPTTNGA
jgi:hypothetical protein